LPTGAAGSATLVKLVNNLVFAAHTQVASDAVRLGAELGIQRDLLLGALALCSGGSNALRYMALAPAGQEGGTARFIRKDFAACRAAAAELGVSLGFLDDVAAGGPLPFV
jgi:3-hydroxyisobutyrate dehydrogenase-like beta-hydroxyacid dehydrogenase